jgi:hypothetical protein
LQRFCAKVAHNFGDAHKVLAMSKPFVPEGEVPRPTNIRDNGLRWAFIRELESASGLKYHG